MPILNTSVNVSWINKPHTFDEITTTTTTTEPPPQQQHREIKKYPPLPSTPTQSSLSWCEKGSQSLPNMKKRISNHSKRKSFSGAATINNNKKLEFFLHRPRSVHSSLPLPPLPSSLSPPPPPSYTPFLFNKDDSEEEENKPLPAVPIDPHSQSSLSSSLSPVSSPQSSSILFQSSPSSSSSDKKQHARHHSYADFEPLTLKDITLILDRNDRMMAYNTAYEKCISTTSPLVNLLKTLKKKPPCPVHQDVTPPYSSHASTASTGANSLPRRSLTLPSLPSRITKKVAILQHQFSMTDMLS